MKHLLTLCACLALALPLLSAKAGVYGGTGSTPAYTVQTQPGGAVQPPQMRVKVGDGEYSNWKDYTPNLADLEDIEEAPETLPPGGTVKCRVHLGNFEIEDGHGGWKKLSRRTERVTERRNESRYNPNETVGTLPATVAGPIH